MKRTILILGLIVMILATSCDDWLDTTPKAQVNSDKLFSTETGFEDALYGVYTSLTSKNTYGMNMTYGFMDVLAQYYKMDNSHILYEASLYNYDNSKVKDVIESMWLTSYNTIANCDLLLENLEKKDDSFFKENYKEILTAEALAVRAYVHFDLLRAFAPAWRNNPDVLCLPYADSYSKKIHKQKTTKEFINLVIQDLMKAKELLDKIDMVFSDDFKNVNNIFYYHYQSDIGKEFTSYRSYRLNYYAINALLARVYNYIGDKKNAYKYAKYIINLQKDGFYAFTTESELSAELKERDIVMQNELLFALNYPGVHDDWYKNDVVNSTAFIINGIDDIYKISDDFRKTYLTMKNSKDKTISIKYADIDSEKGGKVPMIRLSEMYFIAAESIFETNKKEAIDYLSILRLNRGVNSEISETISYEDFVKELTIEARREFIGEGQMFYWYKRLGLPIDRASDKIDLSDAQFCLPLPDTEVEFGSRSEKYLENLK